MRKILVLAILILGLGLTLMAGQEDSTNTSEQEQEKVRLILNQYVEALESENLIQLSQLFAKDDDMVTVNIHIPGIVRGPNNLIATARGWFSTVQDIEVQVKNEVIKICQDGNAAWVSFILDQSHLVPNNQERFEFKGTRVTWGLEKRDGQYLIVQGHWSFVSNGS